MKEIDLALDLYFIATHFFALRVKQFGKKRTCEIGILHDKLLLMLDGGKLRVFQSKVPNFPFSVKFNLKSSFSGFINLFDILQ